MPLGRGVRYRVKTTRGGKKVRLAFKGNKVVEHKVLKGGRGKSSHRRRMLNLQSGAVQP